MTHEEIQELLAGYALNALELSEEHEVSEHLSGCAACQADFQALHATVDRLAEAPVQRSAPAALRARVLASDREVRRTAGPKPWAILSFHQAGQRKASGGSWRWAPRLQWLAAAALIGALSYTTVTGIGTNRQSQATLRRDDAALALLTSTETTNNQLAIVPGAGLPQEAHGHWFHRPGVMTQVIVAEFLPQAPSRQFYEAWLLGPNGWTPAGRMDIDASGYGRVIVLGSDGAGITSVEVTLERGQPTQPSAAVMLRYA